MSDLEAVIAMLNKAKQPFFMYSQIGVSGNYKVMVLDENKDGGRQVPLLFFDIDTKNFVKAGTRWIDP